MPYGRAFPCTVSVDVSGLAAQGTNRPDVVSVLVEFFRPAPIVAIQFLGTDAKVTFERQIHKQNAMQNKSILVNGVDCAIRGGGPRPQNVLIYNFPYEIDHSVVRNALSFYGEVESVRFRHWTHHAEVCDGVRTVRMVRSGAIPRNLIIDGFPVKVAYVGQELECDICGKKGHIAKNCEMRGKCMECKQPGHFQRNCPIRRQRLLRPDEDVETLPVASDQPVLDVVSGPPARSSDGVGSLVAGPSSVPRLDVSPDGVDSQAASQSILAAISKSGNGVCVDGAGSPIDARDNQLDELDSQAPSGEALNSPDSLSGAVVHTPNSVVEGSIVPNSSDSLFGAVVQTPNSDSCVVGPISNSVVNSKDSCEGSIGAVPNSSDSLFGAVVQTPNSVSCVDDPNSNSAVNVVNSKVSCTIDNEDINDNVYETSCEGLLSEEESSDNDSENASDNEMESSDNVVHSANMEVESKKLPSVNIASSKIQSPRSKLPVAMGRSSRSSVSPRIPKASGAGVSKSASSLPPGLSEGLRRAVQDWSVLSKRRK